MSAPDTASPKPDADVDRRRTYTAVIVLEALVLVALWAFSRYFGA